MKKQSEFAEDDLSKPEKLEELEAFDFIEEKEIEIAVKNVTMEFKRTKDEATSMKELFVRSAKHQNKVEKFKALDNVSFTIRKGEVVGILGTNGSGKSTLSLILAGISQIDEGTMDINGEQALIAINTGLDMQLTGLENINVKGALLGLSRKRIQEITEGVIEFAEIGDFLYQPVKKYSSGMKSRLGFSISLYLNPDIIIVDEALSVGDKGFAQKCLDKMNELKDQGKTIIFISHSLPQVRGFCQKAMWIEGGRLKEYGDVEEVCDEYAEYVDFYNSLKKKEKKKLNDEKFESRIVQNPKIGFWEKLLDKMKR